MRHFLIDASALSKRYAAEAGTGVVNCLFSRVDRDRFTCLTLTAGEVISVINRRCNAGRLSEDDALQAVKTLNDEVLHEPRFLKLPMPDEVVVPAFAYIRKHNLNTTDAVILYAALRIQDSLPRKDSLVLVAADERLVRAAKAEGLETIDPERDTDEHLASLLHEPPPPDLAF